MWAYYFKMIKSSVFLILVILPIALQSDRIAKLETKIARYETDPTTGEGKKELLAKARKNRLSFL